MFISVKKVREYPWLIRPFFWLQKHNYGEVLKPGLLWARVPKLFAAVATLYGVINRKTSLINPVLRSLVTVRVSQINSCHFCIDINSMTLLNRSQDEEKLFQLSQWRNSDVYTEIERAVLDYTEAVTFTEQRVSELQVQTLKQFFSEDDIVELTGLIAFQNMSAKFNSALDVPAQGFCPTPGSKE